ncbi:MAG TPA: ABC transporter permease [Acetobacteraceae bacterium]|nr:ABC transporter permease [Acetobacteraceae bacterium]
MSAAVARVVRRRRSRGLFLPVGATLLAAFLLIALLGNVIAPYDPNAQDLLAILDPPSAAHWFGTDEIGRDILSRVIVGTRITLAIAGASVLFAGAAGIFLGLIAGHSRGAADRVITVSLDLLMTVPSLVLAIAVVSAIGANAEGLITAITISFVPSLARLVRARVLELRELDYIEAARAIGMRQPRILLRHILPNAASVIVIELSLMAGQAVLVGTALGFLGLGVQPPAPEWGAMLGASREFLEVAPHVAVVPGLAVSLLVFAFNLFGDGLRDWLDPTATP